VTFKLSDKQLAAQGIITSGATHVMLFGGSRSGKTFLHCRNIVFRALKAPGSRHAILRFRFNHAKVSIGQDTLPKVMSVAFPGVKYTLDKTDWCFRLENGSEIWLGGLDDKERTEKILGQEHVTIYLNEASQIPFGSRNIAVTRLAQKVMQKVKDRPDAPLEPRMYYDCNPPTKGHWTYKVFIAKVDPESGKPLPNPENYVSFQINPGDNRENLPASYLKELEGQNARLQKRFLLGEFADENPNALFSDVTIDKWRVLDGKVPDMVRIVVAVDPSGSDDIDNIDNDAIGIMVVGLGTDGNAYVMEDCTVKVGPAVWGKIATDAYDRHQANIIVGEDNYGGAMVKHTIQTAKRGVPYKSVKATRGKAVRAEPISSLYEQGKVRHVGWFRELENELSSFSTIGYVGENSPNRADALIWAVTELFPALVSPVERTAPPPPKPILVSGWAM
jgi:predicted phage terminase large subunit-like protein